MPVYPLPAWSSNAVESICTKYSVWLAKVPPGLMVITVPPEPVTLEEVAPIISNTLLSEVFFMLMLPPKVASTASENVIIRLAVTFTFMALSDGDRTSTVGAITSAVVKDQLVSSEIPAKLLPVASSKQEVSICT